MSDTQINERPLQPLAGLGLDPDGTCKLKKPPVGSIVLYDTGPVIVTPSNNSLRPCAASKLDKLRLEQESAEQSLQSARAAGAIPNILARRAARVASATTACQAEAKKAQSLANAGKNASQSLLSDETIKSLAATGFGFSKELAFVRPCLLLASKRILRGTYDLVLAGWPTDSAGKRGPIFSCSTKKPTYFNLECLKVWKKDVAHRQEWSAREGL